MGGTKGETIKCISREARVRCELDRNDNYDVKEKVIYIKGKTDSVKKAKELIFEMMYAPKEGEYTDFISIPIDKCGLLIGKKGETIREINQVSGAVCDVDANVPSDTEEKHVIIQGNIEAIEKAKELIKDKLDLLYPHERLLSVEHRSHFRVESNKRTKRNDIDSFEPRTKRSRDYSHNRSSPTGRIHVKDESYTYSSTNLSAAAMAYRKEWAEYYRSMGMIAEASLIEPSP